MRWPTKKDCAAPDAARAARTRTRWRCIALCVGVMFGADAVGRLLLVVWASIDQAHPIVINILPVLWMLL